MDKIPTVHHRVGLEKVPIDQNLHKKLTASKRKRPKSLLIIPRKFQYPKGYQESRIFQVQKPFAIDRRDETRETDYPRK